MKRIYSKRRAAGVIAALLLAAPHLALSQPSGAADRGKTARDRAESQTDEAAAQKYAPDDTGKNIRDRGQMPTADSQSMTASDTELASRIRRAIVGQAQLSTYAHNVKVIVQDGEVTLRGPVLNNAEKQQVAKIARDTAGADKVSDQLEVTER